MKKFTVVYNNVYYSKGIKIKHMIVEWIEGKDMHTHYQSILDENMEVEDVIYFKGWHDYDSPEEDIEVAV